MAKRLCLFACCCLLTAPLETVCQCPGVLPPGTGGFGADGAEAVVMDSVPGSFFTYDKFYLFRPRSASVPLPLVCFIPGMGRGGNDLVTYERLLRHMSSRGYCVVLLTYRMVSFPYQGMTYRRMYRGIRRAARTYAAYADTTRLGMMGHSFGASSIPSHLYRALTKQKWGANGAFMYLMAPHYVFGITQDQLRKFPPHVKLITEVFQDDDCNDHRMAKDLFETIGIPASEKDFIILRSDSNAANHCRLDADHSTPNSVSRGKEVTDALDYYGVYRYFDALADYTFSGSIAAKEIALGNGAPSQRFMGTWPDGTPVREAVISDSAPLIRPRSFYYFHWMHPWNVRRKTYHLSMPDGATTVP
jgi:hypothetical protein